MARRNPNDWIIELKSTEQGLRLLEVERVLLEASELICYLMEVKRVSQRQLAKMIGTSAPRISRILSGKQNLTLEALTEILFVLGSTLHLSHKPRKN